MSAVEALAAASSLAVSEFEEAASLKDRRVCWVARCRRAVSTSSRASCVYCPRNADPIATASERQSLSSASDKELSEGATSTSASTLKARRCDSTSTNRAMSPERNGSSAPMHTHRPLAITTGPSPTSTPAASNSLPMSVVATKGTAAVSTSPLLLRGNAASAASTAAPAEAASSPASAPVLATSPAVRASPSRTAVTRAVRKRSVLASSAPPAATASNTACTATACGTLGALGVSTMESRVDAATSSTSSLLMNCSAWLRRARPASEPQSSTKMRDTRFTRLLRDSGGWAYWRAAESCGGGSKNFMSLGCSPTRGW
mmetsp:Transcript_14739/g.27106  ORF Transcript_14739/g.27106 Transcript_14739/m.27106 type:complete len:317 (+) Transcript_14739:1887-2837(+)